MEDLVKGGFLAGVLDVTTTELADELVGGILSAGPDRLGSCGGIGTATSCCPRCIGYGELRAARHRAREVQ